MKNLFKKCDKLSYVLKLKVILFVCLLFSVYDAGAEHLISQSKVDSATTSTVVDDYSAVTSLVLDVTDVNAVMVTTSFETRKAAGILGRRVSFKLTSSAAGSSGVIVRDLGGAAYEARGLGTMVHVFDVSALSGPVIFELEHATGTVGEATITKASLNAISLTTAILKEDLPYSMKHVTAVTNATTVTSSSIPGTTTDVIPLYHMGDVFVTASLNADKITTDLGAGSWELQYRMGNSSTWFSLGTSISRTMLNNSGKGIISLVALLEDADKGNYYFRIAHRKESLSTTITSENVTLVAVGLTQKRGFFNGYQQTGETIETYSTAKEPAVSFDFRPYLDCEFYMHAQFMVTASDVADAPVFDLTMSDGLYDGMDHERFVVSATDVGSGGITGLAQGLVGQNIYTAGLRHATPDAGVTLYTGNIVLCGIELTDLPIYATGTDGLEVSNQRIYSAANKIIVESEGTEFKNVRVVDIAGRQIYKAGSNSNHFEIPIYRTGVYVVSLVQDGKETIKKVQVNL